MRDSRFYHVCAEILTWTFAVAETEDIEIVAEL
jgi:hypothetical protein